MQSLRGQPNFSNIPTNLVNILNSTKGYGDIQVNVRNEISTATPKGAMGKFKANTAKFSGQGTRPSAIFSHLEQIENLFDTYEIAPKQWLKCFRNSLVGPAFNLYRLLRCTSYNQAKLEFIETYGAIHLSQNIRDEFFELKQGDNTIAEFAANIRKTVANLLDRGEHISDSLMLHQLSSACRDEYKWVLMTKRPKSFKEAIVELTYAEFFAQKNCMRTVSTSAIHNANHQSSDNDRREGYFADDRRSSKNKKGSGEKGIKCYNCGKLGHIAQTCTQRPRDCKPFRKDKSPNCHSSGYKHSNADRKYQGYAQKGKKGRYFAKRYKGKKVHGIEADSSEEESPTDYSSDSSEASTDLDERIVRAVRKELSKLKSNDKQ